MNIIDRILTRPLLPRPALHHALLAELRAASSHICGNTQLEPVQHIAMVGAYDPAFWVDETSGDIAPVEAFLHRNDSLYLLSTWAYLLKSGVPIAENAEIDYVNFGYGRDFLKETSPLDLVVICNIHDEFRHNQRRKTTGKVYDPEDAANDPTPFYMGYVSAGEDESSWQNRVLQGQANIVMMFGGANEINTTRIRHPQLKDIFPTSFFWEGNETAVKWEPEQTADGRLPLNIPPIRNFGVCLSREFISCNGQFLAGGPTILNRFIEAYENPEFRAG